MKPSPTSTILNITPPEIYHKNSFGTYFLLPLLICTIEVDPHDPVEILKEEVLKSAEENNCCLIDENIKLSSMLYRFLLSM
jgi:hypothetical protein